MRFIYTKAFAIFSACLVITVIFVFLQVKGLLSPISNLFLQAPRPIIKLAKNITVPVKNFFGSIYRLRKISDENSQLTARVINLEQNLVEFDQAKIENEALRKELGFIASNKLVLIPCTVLSQNSFGLTDAISLNCGSEQGVSEGQAIVSQGYLVGKIIHVSTNSSTAQLATSSKFLTDATFSKTGANGVVKGSFSSGLFLDQLSQNINVEKGWLVVTAGIDQKIPKNILIGEVGDIISSSNELFKKTTLLSPIDFNNLEFVFVAK